MGAIEYGKIYITYHRKTYVWGGGGASRLQGVGEAPPTGRYEGLRLGLWLEQGMLRLCEVKMRICEVKIGI